jgi:hypothetical protein
MKHILVFAALLLTSAFVPALAAPTVTISGTPASGTPPYQATVTWSSTGATACTAADGWSGSKATSGTQTITITAAIKPSLKCTAASGWTDVVWAPVILNTDGSTLTNLAGYYIYRGTTSANLTKLTPSAGPGATSYRDANLAPGTYVYAVSAVNSATPPLESAKSNLGSSTVALESASASTSFGVDVVPSPPVLISVTSSVAYEIRPNAGGALTASRIGVIPLGTPCSSDTKTVAGVKYNRVSASAIDLINWPQKIPPVDTYARCAGG